MGNFFYRVKRGDTTASLSAHFSVPVSSIIAENGLIKEISAGDVLFLPEVNGTLYRVKAGETAETIAEKFGLDKDELLLKNKTPYFYYGEIIIV